MSGASASLLQAALSTMTRAELEAVLDHIRGTSKRGKRRGMTPAEALVYADALAELEARPPP